MPGFKALLEEWNRKLYESGFRDQEVYYRGERVLRTSGTSLRYQRMDPELREAKFKFFAQVAQLVERTSFGNEMHEQILFLYAQGTSQAEIKRSLKIKGHRCHVYAPIYFWLKAWGLR